MKITWLGHACFKLEQGSFSVVVDPYGPGSVPGYKTLAAGANMAVASHGHSDHNSFGSVKTIKGHLGKNPFIITKVATFHDGESGSLRGENIIHIFEASGLKAVHLGDLGHRLSVGQAKTIGKPDVLMTPVGGYYTIDGKTAAETARQLGARVVIPMHYRNGALGYEVISGLEPFLDCFAEEEIRRYDTDTIEITKDTPPQVAVLRYHG